MSYEVKVTETVIEKLDNSYRDRRGEFAGQIDKLEKYPDKYGKPLSGNLHGIWQLKFGERKSYMIYNR